MTLRSLPSHMRRRQLLRLGTAALPLVLAGCTATDGPDGSGGDADGSPTPTPTPSPSPSPSPTPSPTPEGTTVEVISTDGGPDVPVEYEAAMAETLANDEHPARLRVTIRNPTDAEVVLGEERAVQFHHVTSEDDDLYLLPAGGRVEEFADPGCWRLTDGVAVAEYYGTVAIPAGESVGGESYVLGSFDLPEGACLPTGEHRVVTSGRAASDAESLLGGDGDARAFEWGFTLRVG
jgi:hypothetical protein